MLEKRSLDSLAVFAQANALGTLPGVEAEASWPALSLQRMWPEPGGRVVVTLGKEQPEVELPSRVEQQGLVSARMDQRLGADWQVAAFARLA